MREPARRCRRAFTLIAAVHIAASAGCAAGGGVTAREPDLIAAAEVEEYRAAGVRDLHELVQRARPAWLRSRGDRSINLDTNILVYHNQQRLGTLQVLRDLTILNVVSLRYLDSARAGLLPGAGSQHVEGAIVVETRRDGD